MVRAPALPVDAATCGMDGHTAGGVGVPVCPYRAYTSPPQFSQNLQLVVLYTTVCQKSSALPKLPTPHTALQTI